MKESVKPRRVDQLLSSLGYCSRKAAEAIVKSGRVSLKSTGEILNRVNEKVLPTDLLLDGALLEFPLGLTVLYNKPCGLVCSHDPREGKRIYDQLPERWLLRNPRPTSIGRLDKDTSGLLIITDDGDLNHRLTSPRHKVEKEYQVLVDKPLEEELVARFASGELMLEGEVKPCLPAQLSIIAEYSASVILMEGRYHQVRRMFAACGYHVEKLHRNRLGEWTLDGVAEGEWRELDMQQYPKL